MITLIDLSNLIWSTFYSSLKPNRMEAETCPQGYTGHVDFFHQKLVRILQDAPCNEYIFAVDRKPTHKYSIFPDYKKTRGSSKIKFDPKPAIFEMLEQWKANTIYAEHTEADDAIASFIANNIDLSYTVATTDKDLWQLREIPNVRIYNFHKAAYINDIDLKEAFDIEDYAHIKLVKTLWGDTSDNVPNVAPRLQKSLLPIIKQTDGTLTSFWKCVEQNKDQMNKKHLDVLEKNKNKIDVNYNLVKLNFDRTIVKELATKLEIKKEKVLEEIEKKIEEKTEKKDKVESTFKVDLNPFNELNLEDDDIPF